MQRILYTWGQLHNLWGSAYNKKMKHFKRGQESITPSQGSANMRCCVGCPRSWPCVCISNLSRKKEPQDGNITALILHMESRDLEVQVLNALSSAFACRISWFQNSIHTKTVRVPKSREIFDPDIGHPDNVNFIC